MMYQYPEHTPYMMPYSMDYGIHSMGPGGPDMGGSDMYAGGMPIHAAAMAPLGGHPGHPGLEHYAAESSVHQNIAEAQNNTQVLAALNAAGLGQKVKREDSWLGRSMYHNLRHYFIYTTLSLCTYTSFPRAHQKAQLSGKVKVEIFTP